MKTLDYILLAVFVIALIVLSFFQGCSKDIYFLILGFVVAGVSAVAMVVQGRKKKTEEQA